MSSSTRRPGATCAGKRGEKVLQESCTRWSAQDSKQKHGSVDGRRTSVVQKRISLYWFMSLRIMVQHLAWLQNWRSPLSTEHQLIRDFDHPVPYLELGKSCTHCVGSYLTPKPLYLAGLLFALSVAQKLWDDVFSVQKALTFWLFTPIGFNQVAEELCYMHMQEWSEYFQSWTFARHFHFIWVFCLVHTCISGGSMQPLLLQESLMADLQSHRTSVLRYSD